MNENQIKYVLSERIQKWASDRLPCHLWIKDSSHKLRRLKSPPAVPELFNTLTVYAKPNKEIIKKLIRVSRYAWSFFKAHQCSLSSKLLAIIKHSQLIPDVKYKR